MNVPSDFLPFAAMLLAGGQSRRLGRDKAGLVIGGEPLWQRQLAKLQALKPVELFISGLVAGPYAQAGVEIVSDVVPGCGPLSGFAAVFQRARLKWVLVLAVDLPDVPVTLLEALLRQTQRTNCGVVPQSGDGFEPLAAVYPRSALPQIEESLCGTNYSLQRLTETLIAQGLVAAWAWAEVQRHLFRNLNTPADLQASENWGAPSSFPAQMSQCLEDRRQD